MPGTKGSVCRNYRAWTAGSDFQNKLKMCLHFDQIHPSWHRCLKLAFFDLYIHVKSMKTLPSGEAMIKITFTRPLIIYKSSEPIDSALFSKAMP